MQVIKHLNGIVEFQNVLHINQKILFQYIEYLSHINEKPFEYIKDGDQEYAINKSGFKFNIEDIKQAPSRYTVLSDKDIKKEHKEMIEAFQNCLQICLLEYFKIYPDAITTVWWKSNGHIAGYTKGQWIGPHCDNQVPNVKGQQKVNQIPMHNTISCGLYLNDCVKSKKELNEYNYMGGEMIFPHSALTYTPSSGGVIMYPSNYIGRHQVEPVIEGNRYVFLQFYGYGIPEGVEYNSLDLINI
jgi:hypothetical protein